MRALYLIPKFWMCLQHQHEVSAGTAAWVALAEDAWLRSALAGRPLGAWALTLCGLDLLCPSVYVSLGAKEEICFPVFPFLCFPVTAAEPLGLGMEVSPPWCLLFLLPPLRRCAASGRTGCAPASPSHLPPPRARMRPSGSLSHALSPVSQ